MAVNPPHLQILRNDKVGMIDDHEDKLTKYM